MSDRSEQRKTVRARRHGTTQKDLYDFYPERSMLEDKIEKFCESQTSSLRTLNIWDALAHPSLSMSNSHFFKQIQPLAQRVP